MHKLFIRFLNLLELFFLSARRLRYHMGLSILSLLGVVLAVSLVSSAAFFSHAVDTVIMRQELAEYTRVTGRPPFSSIVFAPSSRTVPFTVERCEELRGHIEETIRAEVGLPVKSNEMLLDSGALTLAPLDGDKKYTGKQSFSTLNLIYFTHVQDHIEIVVGDAFEDGGPENGKIENGKQKTDGDALDVWMQHSMAEKMGVQPGDRFNLVNNQGNLSIFIQIRGIWKPSVITDTFWFSDPEQGMNSKLLVRRADYISHVASVLNPQVRSATWFVVLDELTATPARGHEYIEGYTLAETVIAKYLPDVQMTAPSLSLGKFVGRQATLTTLLLGFNVPALGFLLYFLILTSGVIAYWQRRETAILLSRGMTRWGALGFTLVEGILLFLIAAPLGLWLGMALARIMGYTVSFLSFRDRPPLPVSIEGLNLPLVAATMIILLVAKLWTAALSSSDNVLNQEREHIRPPRGPFWYRAYLDIILLIPTWYGYRQLARQGYLGALVEERAGELYQDPLLIVAPVLFIVVLALVSMRIFPWLMRLLDWMADATPWLSLHLALRQLGRYSHNYISPMLLVIVSLSLGVYTLSMAASMDRWLVDRVYYKTGADLAFSPYSEVESLGDGDQTGADWIPPIDEFRTLPGVENSARVGDYKAEITIAGGSGERVKARFLAVDRVDFSRVAWFRRDFASESLGAMMNRLAAVDDGILVSQKFLEEHHLHAGDHLDMWVLADFDASINSQFTIVGVYRYFPTVYDDTDQIVTVVGNMEHIFSFFSTTMPHRIWMRLDENVAGKQVLDEVEPNIGVGTVSEEDAASTLIFEQAQMERVGVFGTLTVGFIAATFMAALGLLTYSYASLHERMYLFSVMRAIGLKRAQVLFQVAMEYILLILYSAPMAVLIGAVATDLFVPLFRMGTGKDAPLPPLIPLIAQNQVMPLTVGFAGLIIVMELIIITSALYQKLFIALRMGHQG